MRRIASFVTVALLAAAMIVAAAMPTLARQAKQGTEVQQPGDTVICTVGPGAEYPTIQSAVNDPGCQTIQVGVGDYIESVTIVRDVTIVGSTEHPTVVHGAPGGPVFDIGSGATVVLKDLQIMGGSGIPNGQEPQGGGIYNAGTLYRCVGSSVYDNEAAPGTAQDIAGSPAQQCPTSPGPGGPLEGDSVLVKHKGKKELCLPAAALKGHLKHGDEVIDGQGCSDTGQGSRRGSK
jgi:hypothetical protein